VDGNKRVGWAACMEVLRLLGLTIEASEDEAEVFVTAIAAESPDITNALAVAVWLAPRLRAL
jgi:prophage maintenance system killer protein